MKMKNRNVFVYFIALALVLSSILYYFSTKQPEESYGSILRDCIQLCIRASYTMNLSYGPCLSDIFKDEWKHKGWVCDIAHYPRIPLDNKYQCIEFLEGKANKFVELDPNCKPIRIYNGIKKIPLR